MKKKDVLYEAVMKAFILEARCGRHDKAAAAAYLERCRKLCCQDGMEHLLAESDPERRDP